MSGSKANDDSLPPYWDPVAESAVLSAVLLDPDRAVPKVVDFMQPDHFFSEANRRIFEAVLGLFFAKEPIDVVTVASWLRARDRLKQVGGAGYLLEVTDGSPVIGNVRAHAVVVHNAWRRRYMATVCRRLVAEASTGVADVQDWCDAAVRKVGEVAMKNPITPVESNDQVLARILRDAFDDVGTHRDEAANMTGFPTGIHGIDRLLGGLRKAAKTTVSATTGVGKTAFAIQLAVALAKQGVGVLFFSKELKRRELMIRAIAQEANVSAIRLKNRNLTVAERESLLDAQRRLNALPLLIDESPRITIEQLAATAKATKESMLIQHRVPLGMIIDDNVNRAEPSRHMYQRDRHEQLGWHTKNFKILCQELDVVGLELAQAKDPIPGRRPEKPVGGAGIADSSQIAKEADDVIYLWPDGEMKPTPGDPRTTVTAIVAKNRAGPKGEVQLIFRGDTYRFTDPNEPNDWSNPSRQYIDRRDDA